MTTRDEYVEKMKAQLDRWNADIAKWEAKAQETQAGARVEYDKQLAALRQQRDQMLYQLNLLQSAAGNAWVDLVRGADAAWDSMREAIEKAATHFQRK
jgi:hypothetical protein